MATRLQQNETTEALIADFRRLLVNFEEAIGVGDLREKILRLVPLQRTFRELGPSLFSEPPTAGKKRILAYFRRYPFTIISGEEIALVSGINDWPRRIRELRKEEGWSIFCGETVREMITEEPELESAFLGKEFDIYTLKVHNYTLTSAIQDRDAAHRWYSMNEIRRMNKGIKVKILAYLLKNVAHPVSGEELRYVASDKTEWARRVRELRTQEGWKIATRQTGRPDLPVGYYVLEDETPALEHDRNIPDTVRVAVLKRDGFICTECRWDPTKARVPGDPRHGLELHHVKSHVSGGENTVENLTTLCNVCHDSVHSSRAR